MGMKVAEALPEAEGSSTLPLTAAWLVAVLLGIAGLGTVLGGKFALVSGGIAILLAGLQMNARAVMMDATLQLDLRQRFFAALALTILFFIPGSEFGFAPSAAAPAGFFLVGMVIFPLAVWPTLCHLLGALLLLQWWTLAGQAPALPLPLALAGIASVLCALGVTHQHFRHLRHGQAQPSPLPSVVATLGLFLAGAAIALPLTLLLGFALFPWIPRGLASETMVSPAASPEPAIAPEITEATVENLTQLMMELGVLAVAAIIVLYTLSRIWARRRRRHAPPTLDIAREEPWAEDWSVPPPRRRRRHRGGSPRERIIAAYEGATGAMIGRGWEFPAAMTAREFERGAAERAFVAREPLERLTHLFEHAHYGIPDPGKPECDEAVSLAKEIRRAVDQRGR